MQKLEAINTCVEALGFSPLTSANQLTNSLIGNKASMLIDKVVRNILSKGYWFNEEIYTFIKDYQGKVKLPSDTLAIKPWDYNKFDNLAIRSGDLYNLKTHSFDMSSIADGDGGVTVLVIKELTFEDIPEHGADYITAIACRKIVQDHTGDLNDIRERKKDELTAKIALKVEDGSQKKYTAYTCNKRLAHAASVIGGDNAVHVWTNVGGGRGIIPSDTSGGQ